MEHSSPTSVPDDAIVVDRALVRRAMIGLALLLVLAAGAGVTMGEPLQRFGQWSLDAFGLTGLFFGVIVTDSSPLPLTNEPLGVLALSAGVELWVVLVVMCTASVAAGAVGWTAGATLGRFTPIGTWIGRRYPNFERFMQQHGAFGVGVAALTPIPYALATWSAGMVGVSPTKVMLASLLRIPKTLFYVTLVGEAWRLGAGS